jgi:hypothetical protein
MYKVNNIRDIYRTNKNIRWKMIFAAKTRVCVRVCSTDFSINCEERLKMKINGLVSVGAMFEIIHLVLILIIEKCVGHSASEGAELSTLINRRHFHLYSQHIPNFLPTALVGAAGRRIVVVSETI